MALVIRDYVTTECSGNEADDFEKMLEMRQLIQPLADAHGLVFRATALYSKQAIENALLDADEVLRATGGVLPVIWVNAWFPQGRMSREQLSPLEERYHLKLLGEFVDDIAS